MPTYGITSSTLNDGKGLGAVGPLNPKQVEANLGARTIIGIVVAGSLQEAQNLVHFSAVESSNPATLPSQARK